MVPAHVSHGRRSARFTNLSGPVLLVLFAAACGGSARLPEGHGEAERDPTAQIIQGSQISGTLLDGLRAHVRSMTVSTGSDGCPHLQFRGRRSIQHQGNPSVYVDGTLMSDTCILTQIAASSINYVEVFPSGTMSRPGVQRNPMGTIMVYRVSR